MAVSEDTKAIVSQLQKNAEMVRSSNEDTSREVHVRLDKFADAFVSISANIKAQNQMLQTSEKSADERSERERADRDFADLKRDKESSMSILKGVGKEVAGVGSTIVGGVVKGIGGVFKGGLVSTIGRVIKAGLAGFVGYNFIKGFLGPKYDSMFESFESLLTQFTIADIPKAIENMTEAVTKAAEEIEKNVNTAMKVIGGAVAGITALKMYFLGKRIGNAFSGGPERKGDTRAKRQEIREKVRANNQRIREERRLAREEKQRLKEQAKIDKAEQQRRARQLNITQPEPPKGGPKITTPGGNFPSSSDYGRGNFLTNNAANKAMTKGTDGRAFGGRSLGPGGGGISDNKKGTMLSQKQMDEVLKQMGQHRKFTKFVRGASFLVAAWGAYETYQLYKLWISVPSGPEGDELRKQIIIKGFGSLIGSAVGGITGGLIGVFGGPWGILIGSVIGSIGGAYLGSLITGYVYDWANDIKITQKQSLEMLDNEIKNANDTLNDLSRPGPTGQIDAFAASYATGLTTRISELTKTRNSLASAQAVRAFNIRSSAERNQRNMEFAAYGRGGRAMYEVSTHGTPEQKGILLDALIETYRGNKEFFKTVEDFMQTTQTTVINAPNNSSTIMAPVGGAVTKNDVNVLNTGSTGASGTINGLPYIMN